jgi:predicted permease
VVAEVALCVVLLTGAAHLMRGYLQLTRVDLGFDPRNVLFVRPWFPSQYDTAEKKNAFTRQLLERLKAMPGVVSAAQSMLVPPLTHDWSDTIIPGKPHVERWETRFEVCSETYFDVLGLRPLRGSLFTEADVEARRLVTVVNQAFVAQYLRGEDPIGQRVRFQVLDRPFLDAPHNVYFEIVGVVANHKTWGGEWQTVPQAFLPYSVQGFSWRTFLARTSVGPDLLQRGVRDAIWAIDPRVGVSAAGSIEGSLRDFYRDPRFDLVTLGAFAALGLGLVAAGVFSVMAYAVSTRTREIGIRVAIGALGRQIALMVMRTGGRLIAFGYLLGVVAAYSLSRLAAGWLPGISATDPLMLAAAGAVIAVVGLGACLLPALRAARVDPVIALRVE